MMMSVILPICISTEVLEKMRQDKNVTALFGHGLVEVRPKERIAVFQVTTRHHHHHVMIIIADPSLSVCLYYLQNGDDTEVKIHYELLHVVPPMSAPDFIKKSPLANTKVGAMRC